MTPIFIPGQVPSSKNSKVWTGKYLVSSPATTKYINDTAKIWRTKRQDFISALQSLESPYNLNLQFIRSTKHKFDYINPAQTIQDLMVRFEWLVDDNADVILPIFHPYAYDPKNPGALIWIS